MWTKQTDIKCKIVKTGVHQSILCYNLNHYKNKQICNKEAQKGIYTNIKILWTCFSLKNLARKFELKSGKISYTWHNQFYPGSTYHFFFIKCLLPSQDQTVVIYNLFLCMLAFFYVEVLCFCSSIVLLILLMCFSRFLFVIWISFRYTTIAFYS